MACGFLPVQQFVGPPTTRSNLPRPTTTTTLLVSTNTKVKDNLIMATDNNKKIGSDQIHKKRDNNLEGPSADLQRNGQLLPGSNPVPSRPTHGLGLGFLCSQLVPDHPNNSNPKSSDKATTIITTNNITASSSCSSTNNSIFSVSNNSILTTVTKVVNSSDDEQEAFLAEIDSDLPNMLSRTFMGQDARFSFILFFSVFSFSLVLGLFVIQASYAWHNYQLLEMLGREDFSEEFFYLHYYDPPEHLSNIRPSLCLRVNTSFYVH